MNLQKTWDNGNLDIALEGRLDTATAPELDRELKADLDRVEKLSFDFEKLEYISSAGLRVLLWVCQSMEEKGGMKIRNANSIIREIFDITGLSEMLE